jgi:hypothetical protein
MSWNQKTFAFRYPDFSNRPDNSSASLLICQQNGKSASEIFWNTLCKTLERTG